MLAALIVVAVIAVLIILVLSAAIKVLREYERGVIFRLGRLLGAPKGPRLIFLIPIIDRMVKVDLRTITLMIPPQEVITGDNVPARVNAVCYFRVVDASASVVQVENFMVATSQIAQTTLRSVLGQHSLDELLSEREKINSILQEIIDEATAPWGIKVAIVEVKDVEIPADMQRAMARQAEAERERRAKIINAEGEFQAAERLKEAALVMEEAPIALQLRYLQTLLEVGSANNSTIVFPAPIDLLGRSSSAPNGTGEELSRAAPELRRDPLSSRLVVVAPDRARRPGAFPQLEPPPDPGELDECPFCAGREDRTPPETLRFPDEGGWRVRVVPNLYPAFERQEVVVHTPEHVRSIAELRRTAGDRGGRVASTSRGGARRRLRLRPCTRQRGQGRRRQPSPHALTARLAPRAAAAVVREGEMDAVTEGEAVLERGGVVVLCPAVSTEPYEMRVAPAKRESDAFESPLLAVALGVAAEALRRLRAVEHAAPANLWLHDGPWWHIDLVPRLTVAAGIELGAGIHVNPLPPEEAAARLRG